MPMGLFGSTRVKGRSKHVGHNERRKRREFLTGKEIEAIYFDEFEAEISKNCATEFDKRLNYVFKVPEILEKAWEMPWGWGKSDDFKPVLVFRRDILPISHANDGVHNAYDYLWEFVREKIEDEKRYQKFLDELVKIARPGYLLTPNELRAVLEKKRLTEGEK